MNDLDDLADHHVAVSLHVMPPSSSATATSPSVFWPKGCTKDGMCYGWLNPAICVAGVFEVSCHLFQNLYIPRSWTCVFQDSVAEQNANALLTAALARSTIWKPLKKCCGGKPTLIGRCWFEGNHRSWVPTSFKLLDREEEPYSFVLYHSHAPNSLRFYSLAPPQVIKTPLLATCINDPFRTMAKFDFTRPHPVGIENALNATLLDQVSHTMLVSLDILNLF
jgi:phosphatidylinositol glycan class Q protein